MTRPLRIALFVSLALVSTGLGVWLGQQASTPAPTGYPDLGGDFSLQSAAGPVSLTDYRGQVVAIYFGYTHCPDICPTSLAALAQAIGQLDPAQQAEVQGIFITVDPERDTPERATAYGQAFHPRITGVSGTPEAIAEVAKRYFVLHEKVPLEDSAMGYAVDHSSIMYLLDRRGVVQHLVRHSDAPGELAQHLKDLLAI